MKYATITTYFGHETCDYCAYEVFTYPGGEMQVRFKPRLVEKIKEVDGVRIIARIFTPKDIIELALLTSAVEGIGIEKGIQLILPYLPYARADRRFTAGDCFGLETFGNILASMSPSAVITLDAHSAVSELKIPNIENVSPLPLIEKAIVNFSRVTLGSQTINVLFPDEGAFHRYNQKDLPAWSIPDAYSCNVASVELKKFHASKVREPLTGKLTGFDVPEMPDNPTIMVDDICDGGATFIGIAKELKKRNQEMHLGLYVSHGIFSKTLAPLMEYIEEIYCSNSYFDPTPFPGVKYLNCEPMLLKAAEKAPRTVIYAA